MFVLYGPNTNHGSGSVPYTLESQFNYVVDAARRLREGDFRWIDLRPEAQLRWRREIERAQRRHRLGDRRLLELVPERPRREHEQLARAVARVPAADATDRPGGLPGGGLSNAGQRSPAKHRSRRASPASSVSHPCASGSCSSAARIASSAGARSCALTVE